MGFNTDIISATTISGGTFYGDGSNLTGVTVTPSYKVYTALLTQTGTTAPAATVFENTLGGAVTWEYYTEEAPGSYKAVTSGLFTENKTVTVTSVDVTGFPLTIARLDSSTVTVYGTADDTITNTFIEIRVYN